MARCRAQSSAALYRLNADLEFVESIPAPDDPPYLVAALAIRSTPIGSEIWSITWRVPAEQNVPQVFELWVQDTEGDVIDGPTVRHEDIVAGGTLTLPAGTPLPAE